LHKGKITQDIGSYKPNPANFTYITANSSFLGSFVGILPAAGATPASLMAYGVAKTMSLRNILRRIDNQVTDELFLNSGIYLGIAAMIYLPSTIFFFVFLFALILFSTAVTRRLLLASADLQKFYWHNRCFCLQN